MINNFRNITQDKIQSLASEITTKFFWQAEQDSLSQAAQLLIE
jgi:hypothetical protein